MKLIKTNNSIISLENVRRVDLETYETKHTTYGKPYTISHYEIRIHYTDNLPCERIDCGEDALGKQSAETWFSKIADILSDDPA